MRAKVEIFDEHTGRVICEEKIFPPYKEEYDPITRTWQYEFRVKAVVKDSYYEELLDREFNGFGNKNPDFLTQWEGEFVRSVKEATDEEIQEVLKGETNGVHET